MIVWKLWYKWSMHHPLYKIVKKQVREVARKDAYKVYIINTLWSLRWETKNDTNCSAAFNSNPLPDSSLFLSNCNRLICTDRQTKAIVLAISRFCWKSLKWNYEEFPKSLHRKDQKSEWEKVTKWWQDRLHDPHVYWSNPGLRWM